MDKSNEEEDEDLYSDLPNFKYDETIDKLQENNKELKAYITRLEELVKQQTKEIEEYRSQCATLTKNISSLLKTAQNEIQRKDQKINDLNKSVLELKTEVLISRKRKVSCSIDSAQQPLNGVPLNKQQKIDATSPKYDNHNLSFNLEQSEKEVDGEEKGVHNPKPPENLVTPDIKCHTLYSQRMYNKIYNVDIKKSSNQFSDLIDANDKTRMEDLIVNKTDSENNKPPMRTEPSYEVSSNDTHQEISNLSKNKFLIKNSIDPNEATKKSNIKSNKPNFVFSSFFKANKYLVPSNKNDSDCNTKKTEKISLTSWIDSTEIEKDVVDCSNKILSIVEEKLKYNSKSNKVIKTSNGAMEEERILISKNESEKGDIVEALFGSPLKWTENSVDDLKQIPNLSLPATAFEDSCSAHIENIKFKKVENGVADVSNCKVSEISVPKKIEFTERKCSFQPSSLETSRVLPSFHSDNKSVLTSSREISKHTNSIIWPFKKTSNDIPSKPQTIKSSIFSSFVNVDSTSEACDVPSLKGTNQNTSDNISVKLNSPKYNDSILGQFDDTTQLINALAKDPSKLSPIHTPVKETKLDNTSSKTQSSLVEKRVTTRESPIINNNSVPKSPPAISIEQKTSATSYSSVDKAVMKDVSEIPPSSKKPAKPRPLASISKMTSKSSEKKVSIHPAVISTVQKKLSVPSSLLSPVEKNLRKKTILLDKPINILCPRKTPRVIGRNKNNQSATNDKQSKDVNNSNVGVPKELKSPSPLNDNSSLGSCPVDKTTTFNNSKNEKVVTSSRKSCSVENSSRVYECHIISSSEEKSRSSKSPLNVVRKFNRESPKDNRAITNMEVKDCHPDMARNRSFRKEHSPYLERSHHYSSRKENIPRRNEHKSHSRKEDSPTWSGRSKWSQRDSKPEVFKRPELRRESFRRPNCYFRQSSVERRIFKHRRFSRSTPIRTVKTSEGSDSSSRLYRHVYENKFDPRVQNTVQSPSPSSKSPVISRSSKISWSASTGVVSTKPPNSPDVSDLNRNPTPQIKWILRPIDFDTSPANNSRSQEKPVQDGCVNVPLNPKPETEMHDKSLPLREPDTSPGKPANIVIVAERRPIKFCSNN